jgi:hypothetical protein
MSDDFKMTDLGKPLYEWSQVLTLPELVNTYTYIKLSREHLPWFFLRTRYELKVALALLSDMITFLKNGKKAGQNV